MADNKLNSADPNNESETDAIALVLDDASAPERVSERLSEAIRLAGGPSRVMAKSGVKNSTLRRVLNGQDAKRGVLVALADACGVSVEWLATGRHAMAAAPLDTNSVAADVRIRYHAAVSGDDTKVVSATAERIVEHAFADPHSHGADNGQPMPRFPMGLSRIIDASELAYLVTVMERALKESGRPMGLGVCLHLALDLYDQRMADKQRAATQPDPDDAPRQEIIKRRPAAF